MCCNYYIRYLGSTMSTQASTRQCMFHLEFYVENHPFHSPLLTPGGHTTTWYFKYGKACLQLAERILERMPKSDSHSAVWRNVIKLYSCPLIQVEIKVLFEFLDKFIIPSLTRDNELGFSSGYLERLWPAIVLKHNETLSKMLMSQSKYFPSTEEQVKLSLKDPAAIKHFNLEVQRPMLQEALKVIKDHGTEWLSFPKLFGMGADQEF